jgi:choice-of-anchor B domain-containing protein
MLADRNAAPPVSHAPLAATACSGGFAGIYPCQNVDLLSFMPLNTIGGGGGNDVWGWTDPADGAEYALMGRTTGTAFVDVSDPENPVYLGNLPTQTNSSTWRDIKVYADHAFIVSEASGHGMQVFDLTRLRNVVAPPAQFTADAVYTGFSSAHNIVINADSGFAYGVGTNTCAGGLHMIDIMVPTSPVFAGCFSGDGYTHDAQCVTYQGPDPDYQGAEICFNANEDTVTIVDVTDKANPVQISRTGYSGDGYTHQGWVTDDHKYFLFDDELDEICFGHNTRTRVFDIVDLDSPRFAGFNDGRTGAIDHNQYVAGNRVYQANYRAGLSILDASDVANATLPEIGYFDIYPNNNGTSFDGAWSTYPYFESGTILISGIGEGLFMVRLATGGQDLTLGPPNPGVAGVVNTWALSNATPAGRVFLLAGLSNGSTTLSIPNCPGLSVAIANARFIANTSADSSGNGTFTRSLPAGLSQRAVRFQAVDRASCATSNLELVTLD